MVVLGGADDPTHKLGDIVDHTRQQHATGLPEKPSNVSCHNGNGHNPLRSSASDSYKYYYDADAPSESDWQSTSPASSSSTRQMLGDGHRNNGSSFRSSSIASSQTQRPSSSSSSSSRRFTVPFVKKIDWGSLWDKSKEWIRNPMNMALSVWILAVGVSGAILFMVMTGMLNRVLPSKPQRDTWFEVNNQILNALFTLMCLYQHPRRFYHLALLCRWRAGDMHQLRQVYCKDGTCKPNERKHMMVVILLLHLNCFAQYALCGLNLGYRRPQRPVIGVALTISVAICAPAVAGLYNNLSPLGKDYEAAQPEADDEESQLQRKTPETERRYTLVPRQGHGSGSSPSSPQWVGGLLGDMWEDMSLAYLSVFCSCCVFGWNMSRLGLGNMYVHVATFVLLCLAPFFIFDLAAISVDDEAVRDALGLAGVFLCVFGLLYGGFWRIQMRRRFGLPENRACCGKPDLTDCMQWLCCYSCSLAQEVRTADAYEVVLEDKQQPMPMPMHHPRHHPTLQEELSTMQEPLRFAGVFASPSPHLNDDGVTIPPSSLSATRT
ncbi:hypothetical protein BDA96_08G002200 [Sorghum bicolor]|uniref:PLAC8 family protein n=2 Tax=Sorghum bicolor TaxID=4558 RepID=A0A921QD57_SORBI|nr:uncharacterized protein LOC8055477 [Sorghum bicolor]XP_021302166.1 uncharacterized protein LOC8055477 [Sorghum bicolor]KAG0519617.1 hypothetical protein BDA96_08G002200 [Sorghum bicolor]KAG0519618.1 hypothetical protein BDA96_08G002200 [Sorghum bicolor]|eukprot:XP_002442639.1 uncharacterized protein LOC8055477 [Sorghum bicolor]